MALKGELEILDKQLEEKNTFRRLVYLLSSLTILYISLIHFFPRISPVAALLYAEIMNWGLYALFIPALATLYFKKVGWIISVLSYMIFVIINSGALISYITFFFNESKFTEIEFNPKQYIRIILLVSNIALSVFFFLSKIRVLYGVDKKLSRRILYFGLVAGIIFLTWVYFLYP